MAECTVVLKDGSERSVEKGTTLAELAAAISGRLGREAVAGKVDGVVVDLSTPLVQDAAVEILTLNDAEGLAVMRHSTAHCMAQAVARLYPGTKFAIGPVIENGFYYDFADHDFTPDEFSDIEREMQAIIKEDLPIRREEVSRDDALRLFEERKDRFKVEIIQDLPEGTQLTLYRQGEFVDLCRGPHLPSTGRIKAFRLMSLAGAYWRGDSKREMLTRLYAVAFAKKSELDEHLKMLEEAKQRDHRKLGKELELFMFSEDAPGMPFYLPNGLVIRNELESFERALQVEYGYQEVRTPTLMNQRLWVESGHWDHYRENMYVSEADEELYALKPMNCPGHMLIYRNKLRSYRDLPLRISEYGHVHRHELRGTLGGMMRVRAFTQDDAHIFCRPDQIGQEVERVLALVAKVYGVFGFTHHIELSTRPDDSLGSDELWNQAESALQAALDGAGVTYHINPGDGAFYGPKIDFHIKDAIGRTWQCATVQLDFNLPIRFDLEYIGEDGKAHRPVVIHRAIFGSVDRFLGILTEHFAGAFPLWLAPVQVRVATVSHDFADYGAAVEQKLKAAGIRAEVDLRGEKIGYKIREAQVHKIPYTVVVGEKERDAGTLSVRRYGTGDLGTMNFADFVAKVKEEVASKELLKV
ncbi:MAG: threonine--tRNA ligase [Alicyclobacillaceae bacterium]|uniref:threonine--tRNA ligase n=1 Tax=Alicyclobacillus sp. SP_1 TaxID=2942475 RepID=UPI0021588034|nr:threonine--tRNA ligase [Alicyclobacillus sp. SP_1]MCY0888076.1 threonine--tRNA ligase [Alicyclobacillaceae bacterium]